MNTEQHNRETMKNKEHSNSKETDMLLFRRDEECTVLLSFAKDGQGINDVQNLMEEIFAINR